MMLVAASHGPAHRRPGQDGRFPTHRGKGRAGSHLGDGAALSRDSTAPPMGEGSRKGDLKKACLTSILSAYRS